MKNLRAICDAAISGTGYENMKDAHKKYLDIVEDPNLVRKLLDVIELQREALEELK